MLQTSANEAPVLGLSPTPEDLRRFVREHEVCWELVPHYEYHHDEKVAVGMDLELFAWVPGENDPGSPACVEAYAWMREVVAWAIPSDANYSLNPFDAAFYLRPEAGYLPMLRLAAQVRHEHGTFQPLDESERHDLHVIQERLETLGAQERSWRRASA